MSAEFTVHYETNRLKLRLIRVPSAWNAPRQIPGSVEVDGRCPKFIPEANVLSVLLSLERFPENSLND